MKKISELQKELKTLTKKITSCNSRISHTVNSKTEAKIKEELVILEKRKIVLEERIMNGGE
jgi:peptidoglycan hydrolase CwlO-like protein